MLVQWSVLQNPGVVSSPSQRSSGAAAGRLSGWEHSPKSGLTLWFCSGWIWHRATESQVPQLTSAFSWPSAGDTEEPRALTPLLPAVQQLQLLGRLCQEQGIPFPPISPSPEEQRQPRECHLFLDPDCPDAPAVLHFPLVDDSFRHYSAPGEPLSDPLQPSCLSPQEPQPCPAPFSPPGLPRTPEEEEAGEVNLSSSDSPYHYSKLTYSPEDTDKLLRLTHYNICNNRERLLEALRGAVQRRRQRRRHQPQ